MVKHKNSYVREIQSSNVAIPMKSTETEEIVYRKWKRKHPYGEEKWKLEREGLTGSLCLPVSHYSPLLRPVCMHSHKLQDTLYFLQHIFITNSHICIYLIFVVVVVNKQVSVPCNPKYSTNIITIPFPSILKAWQSVPFLL